MAGGRGNLSRSVQALRHRDFALFWTGALVSNIGTWMQNAAIPYVIYELTGSKALIGVAAFLQFVPVVFLAPLGGSLADRLPRRRMLFITQTVMAVLALLLWAMWGLGAHQVWALLLVVGLSGAVGGLNIPSWQAFIPELVPRDDLLNAVTLNSAQFNAARAVGPALAGLVLATLGPGAAFLVNALSFGAVLWALALVKVAGTPAPTARRRVLREFTEGLRYVRRSPEIFVCILLVMAVAALGMPVVQLMPVFATDVFHTGSTGYGILTGALGMGGVFAAPIVGGWGTGVRRSRLAGVSVGIYGVALALFASSPSIVPAVVFIAVAGMGFLSVVSTLNTTVQLLVEERLRGRVMAIYVMGFTAAYPLGALVQGWLAEQIGTRSVVAGAGVLLVVLCVGLLGSRVLQRLDRATPVEVFDDVASEQAVGALTAG